MEISLLDMILLNAMSYLFGTLTGLLVCCKYKDTITKSRSIDNLKLYNQFPNPNNQVIQASAPPPPSINPVKLTIE